jgi:hypothetical protein
MGLEHKLVHLSGKGANPEGWVYKSEAEMGLEQA